MSHDRIVGLDMSREFTRHEAGKFSYDTKSGGNEVGEFAYASWSSNHGWRGWVFRPLGKDPEGRKTLVSLENGLRFDRDGLSDPPSHANEGTPCAAFDLTDTMRSYLEKRDYRVVENDEIVRVMKRLAR